MRNEKTGKRKGHRSVQALAVAGAGSLGLLGFRAAISLFGPTLPYSLDHIPGNSNESPEFLEFLSIVTNAPVRHAHFRPLVNGPEFYPAELDAIRAAERSIEMENYLWHSGEIVDEFVQALTERASHGVEVRLVLDAIGSLLIPNSLFDKLRAAGGKMFWYHPLRWNTWPMANNRTHRKLLVIDGHTAFVGGAGVADQWMRATGSNSPQWRDTMIEATGEAAAQVLSIFSENWLEASGEILSGKRPFKLQASTDGAPSLVIASTPSGGGTTARILFQSMIKSAQKSIDITTPYFLPDHSARRALEQAARNEDVRVRILVAGPHIDHDLIRRVSRHDSRHLLRAGAEVYEYQPSMIHAKLMVIDGRWCVFGSTNFDHRSFALNDEINVAALDRKLAASLTRQFEADLGQSRRLTARMTDPKSVLGAAELAGGSLLERES